MPGSEQLQGFDHPSTFTEQPAETHRTAQLSGELHGEGNDHGYKQPLRVVNADTYDYGPDN